MNTVLLLKNLFFIKKKYLKYLSIILLSPMLMYTMNVLILSDFYESNSIENWTSIGIWISCPIICSYIYTYDIISNFIGYGKKANFMISSHISVFSILVNIIIASVFIAFLSFLTSYLIVYSLIGVSVSLIQFIYLIITVFSIVLLFIPIGLFLGMYDRNNIGVAFVMLICCCVIQFSYFSNSDFAYKFNPIFDLIRNCSSFILNSSNYKFSFKPILVMYSISTAFLFAVTYVLAKLINKKYEK